MLITTHNHDGEIINEAFGTLEEEQQEKVGAIKDRARQKIINLESDNARIKADEQDRILGGYRLQAFEHKVQKIREWSNLMEAQIMALTDPKEVAAFDFISEFEELTKLGEIPAVLTPVQFQTIAAIAMGENGAVRFGDVINSAEAMIMNNGGVRYAMDRYAKATSIVKHDAEAMLRSLIDAGVEGFSEDDLNAVMAAWPIL